MSDLPYIQQTQEVKITGQDSSGNTVNYVGADTNGNLKVIDYATGAIGAAIPVDAVNVGGKDGSGNLQAGKIDANGSRYTVLTSAAGAIAGLSVQLTAGGALSISGPTGTLFEDLFDGLSGLDTTNRWNLTNTGSGTLTQTGGQATILTTTTASSAVQLSSQPSFNPDIAGFFVGLQVQMEATIQTNTNRFWGLGTPAASFTATTPLLNAIGFEIDTSANLNAVIYSNGTKVQSTNLNAYKSSSQLIYAINISPNAILFYISTVGFEIPVASFSNFTIQSLNLPFRVHMINGTSGPASAPSLILQGSGIAAISPSSATIISDGTFQWRKAKVDSTGQISVKDVLNVTAQQRAQSVTTSAAEALGAATILSNRKLLHITPTNGTIYWGYVNTVTISTGTPLFPNNTLWLSVTDNIHVYVIAATTIDTRIGELS